MACDILAGRVGKICKDSLGGNAVLYIWNYLVDPFTFDSDTGLATAVNVALTTVFQFDLEGDNNTLEQVSAPDQNNGGSVVTQTGTFQFKKMDAATTGTFNLLKRSYNQYVVKDRNGNYIACALDDGADWATGNQTGGSKTDLNGYNVIATSTVGDLAPILDESTITAFLALV